MQILFFNNKDRFRAQALFLGKDINLHKQLGELRLLGDYASNSYSW